MLTEFVFIVAVEDNNGVSPIFFIPKAKPNSKFDSPSSPAESSFYLLTFAPTASSAGVLEITPD